GFGLAAVVNFLLWSNNNYKVSGLKVVSQRMLYHMAQLYDEWAGEDYEGSSCRGAMKGWHRHGVCHDVTWPYRDRNGKIKFISPKPKWEQEAAQLPLGAYYRIDIASINDLQSAIHEVGAVYCSASVHNGWYIGRKNTLPIIKYYPESIGGHAFALVGYTEQGFIVQNSWGPDWGYHGFAILSYEDWVRNGSDAWVAVMGAPMTVSVLPTSYTTRSLQESAAFHGAGAGSSSALGAKFSYKNKNVQPITESRAYEHTLVLGNNGMPIHRLVNLENASVAVKEVCVELPKKWFNALPVGKPRKIAIYVHGGLNSETDSIIRIRMMAPYFIENDIYPLFITWKTGAMESIGDILSDSIREIFNGIAGMRDEGVFDQIKNALAEKRDRAIEVACEKLLIKSMWSEMKQNAAASAESGAGLAMLAAHLLSLKKMIAGLEIHLVGHSAGSIVLGHLLSLMDKSLSANTLSLFAPACTLGFANKYFGSALAAQKISASNVHLDILNDERELADTVGPYGKSLLYLVSRSLESRHKMPLLGMEWVWKTDSTPEDQWSSDDGVQEALKEWPTYSQGMTVRLHDKTRKKVLSKVGGDPIKLAHGSFDNDIEVIGLTLERIRGEKLIASVENLDF
ncbi:MAG: C1 family peptidase, partial [Pseudomonadota bacterium]|nr:C1 family peptidase [Pseudomonadota bacterium]